MLCWNWPSLQYVEFELYGNLEFHLSLYLGFVFWYELVLEIFIFLNRCFESWVSLDFCSKFVYGSVLVFCYLYSSKLLFEACVSFWDGFRDSCLKYKLEWELHVSLNLLLETRVGLNYYWKNIFYTSPIFKYLCSSKLFLRLRVQLCFGILSYVLLVLKF